MGSLVDEILERQTREAQNPQSRILAQIQREREEQDSTEKIDFGSCLLSLSKLSTASGIGMSALRWMVRNGMLKKYSVPGSTRTHYSAAQLTKLVEIYNQRIGAFQ